MQQQLTAVIREYTDKDLHHGGSIPPKKLEVAVSTYPVPRDEVVLALIDATVFGSAKVGMVIGLGGIYWKNDWSTESARTSLSWPELLANSHLLQGSMMKLSLGPGMLFDMSGCGMKTARMAELLRRLAVLHATAAPAGAIAAGAAGAASPGAAAPVPSRRAVAAASAPPTAANGMAALLDNPEWSWNYDRLFVAPSIPPKKLRSAIDAYAHDADPDSVLLLIDDTVFGSAADGLLVTRQAMYAHSRGRKRKVLFADEPAIEMGSSCRVIVNGEEFFKGDLFDHLALLTVVFRLKHMLGMEDEDEDEDEDDEDAASAAAAQRAPRAAPDAARDSAAVKKRAPRAAPADAADAPGREIERLFPRQRDEQTFFRNFRTDYRKLLASEGVPPEANGLYLALFDEGQRVASGYRGSRFHVPALEGLIGDDEVAFQAHILVAYFVGVLLEPFYKDNVFRLVAPLGMIGMAYAAYCNQAAEKTLASVLRPMDELGATPQMVTWQKETRAYVRIGSESEQEMERLTEAFVLNLSQALWHKHGDKKFAAYAYAADKDRGFDEYFREFAGSLRASVNAVLVDKLSR